MIENVWCHTLSYKEISELISCTNSHVSFMVKEVPCYCLHCSWKLLRRTN
jgi:hypothetical protein